MNCRICDSGTEFFSEAKILFKYDIKYYKCPNCGFVQTENPFWLDESYSEVINKSDIGLIKRNFEFSEITKSVIKSHFNKNAKYVDYGAGYGIFVRLMRDYGYDFYWQDKYCENLFAKEFEAKNEKYELLTAFEVFEHLKNPLEEIKQMLYYSDSILFSTFIIPASYPKPEEWWYYALDHGQHISLYSIKSLEQIAKTFGLNFYTNGKNIHLLSKEKKNGVWFKLITYPYLSKLFIPFSNRKSLHDSDYNYIIQKLKK
jgi:2-polyprenyl-3-methyl-5-hydroxy-6-metoxy-1,4-benzoquinol methylase